MKNLRHGEAFVVSNGVGTTRHSSLPIVPAMEHALHHNWITRSILSSARAAETVQSSTQTTLNSICGSNAARNYLFNFQYIRQPSNWFNLWRCFVHVHTIHVHRHRPVGETTCLKQRWVLSWPDYDLT